MIVVLSLSEIRFEHNYSVARRRVIPEKYAPSLVRRTAPYDHVLGHARLGDLKSELKQFAVNARGTLKSVLNTHFPD